MNTIKTAPRGAWKGFCLKLSALLLIGLIVALHNSGAFAQSSAPPLPQFSAEQLRQDINALHDSLEKLHPGFYRYRSKREIDKIFSKTLKEINQPMTVTAYFRYIDYLVSSADDGHTECFMPGEVNQWVRANADWFPAQLWLSGQNAYVPINTRYFPAGTEILAINGIPMQRIIHDMLDELSSDGANLTHKYDKINGGHDPFPYMYFVLNGSRQSFRVDYRASDGSTGNKTIPSGKVAQVEGLAPTPPPAKYLTLDYKPGGVAVMTVRTVFNELLSRTGEKFGDFLNASFEELHEKHISKLIIDLRGNGGGDDENGALRRNGRRLLWQYFG